MLKQLLDATRFDPAACLALSFGGERVGWVEPAFAGALARFPQTFAQEPGQVRILSTARIDEAVRELAADSWIAGWRNERYAVRSRPDGPVLFELERAAFRRFGMLASAAHLNARVPSGEGWRYWIARRSRAKPIDPGMLDNLVAGGIAAGSTPIQTLLRECGEEAGIAEELARDARAAGTLRVRRAVRDGVNNEVIHVFDLELPSDFVPANHDGEVAEFMLLTQPEVASRIEAGEFTVDAGAVMIDHLWRTGALADPALGAALRELRAPRQP